MINHYLILFGRDEVQNVYQSLFSEQALKVDRAEDFKIGDVIFPLAEGRVFWGIWYVSHVKNYQLLVRSMLSFGFYPYPTLDDLNFLLPSIVPLRFRYISGKRFHKLHDVLAWRITHHLLYYASLTKEEVMALKNRRIPPRKRSIRHYLVILSSRDHLEKYDRFLTSNNKLLRKPRGSDFETGDILIFYTTEDLLVGIWRIMDIRGNVMKMKSLVAPSRIQLTLSDVNRIISHEEPLEIPSSQTRGIIELDDILAWRIAHHTLYGTVRSYPEYY